MVRILFFTQFQSNITHFLFSIAELLQEEPSIDDDDELVQVPLDWYLYMRELKEKVDDLWRRMEILKKHSEKCTCGARNETKSM